MPMFAKYCLRNNDGTANVFCVWRGVAQFRVTQKINTVSCVAIYVPAGAQFDDAACHLATPLLALATSLVSRPTQRILPPLKAISVRSIQRKTLQFPTPVVDF
eukprot:1399895-Amphidinium_carterae.1